MRTFSIIWQFVYIYNLLLYSHPHNSRRYLQSKNGSFIWKQLSDYCDILPTTKVYLGFYEVQYINSFCPPQSCLSWISSQWRTYFIKGVIKFLFLISIFQIRVAWNSAYTFFIECCWKIVNFVKISDDKSCFICKYKRNVILYFIT
jgi:hypothetical protein